MARKSSRSLKRFNFPLSSRQLLFLGLLAAIAMGIYVAIGFSTHGAGFPLDDAWIHQTYARNLALRGEWAFVPGQPSAGATSPLWVALLALGVRLDLTPYVWTFFLGWLSLLAIGILVALGFARLSPQNKKYAVWVGALVIVDFHMVWAAVSGMETALFTALCMYALLLVLLSSRKQFSNMFWVAAGLAAGAAAWVRPEGLTLIAPLSLAVIFSRSPASKKTQDFFKLLESFGLVFILYLAFNHSITGGWWPNTLAAKQAEYASLLNQPFFLRLVQQLIQPLVGAGFFLLPGFMFAIYRSFKTRNWSLVWCALWALGFLSLFALRMPVTYQHGRYAMPTIPIYFLISSFGLVELRQLVKKKLWRTRSVFTWASGLAMLAISVFFLGLNSYAKDLDFINSEMVQTALWVKANTPQTALVAAHDIGALGYFSDRHVLDLAGLVSPEVIPFIRDESELARYLNANGADYLVTFPSWYPQLSRGASSVFQAPDSSYEPMTVYTWPK